MPLSNIVSVVLRLFAIQMIGQSVGMALSFAASFAKESHNRPDHWVVYRAPAALLAFAFLEWWLAPTISRLVTRHHDAEVALGTLSPLDLYSFAFVFLGLYFILSSVPPTLTWLHYPLSRSAIGSTGESQSSFYRLASPLLSLIAGVFALVPARRWARRLLAQDSETSLVRPHRLEPAR
jgi:hypothetical protein